MEPLFGSVFTPEMIDIIKRFFSDPGEAAADVASLLHELKSDEYMRAGAVALLLTHNNFSTPAENRLHPGTTLTSSIRALTGNAMTLGVATLVQEQLNRYKFLTPREAGPRRLKPPQELVDLVQK